VPDSKIESGAEQYSEWRVVLCHDGDDLYYVVVEHQRNEFAVLANKYWKRALSFVAIAFFT
jgi:hypothetical protein